MMVNKLRVHPLFGNGAVLQRGQPLTVRGWAASGDRVTVNLAGEQASAVADETGRWQAGLPAMRPIGDFELVVRSDSGEELCLRNIRFGEIWLCSGQSNMEWELIKAKDAGEELKVADLPMVSLFHVPRLDAADEQESVGAAWTPCTKETAAAFSAVAFFFAREIQPRLGVPVGLISAAWGGTVAEAWMPKSAFSEDPELENLFAIIQGDADPQKQAELKNLFEKEMEEWRKKACPQDPGNQGERMGWQEPDFDDSRWRVMSVPGFWEQQLKLDADGAIWFRKKFILPPEWEGRELTLRLGAIDDFDHTYVNGRFVGRIGPENPESYCTPRVYPVPAGICRAGENTVAVRIFDHMGTGGFGGGDRISISPSDDAMVDPVLLSGEWRYEIECLFPSAPYRSIPPMPPWPTGLVGPTQAPCRIFNAMIAPLVGFPLAGVLWYQGESNEIRPDGYPKVFGALIRSWRQLWKRELPFFFVQLANFGTRSNQPMNHAWARVREAQRRTLELPATGMASAVDIGDSNDIHPTNKQEVGRRLSLLARSRVYGEIIEDSGPLLKAGLVDRDTVRLEFDHAGGLRFRCKPEGFAIMDDSDRWRWAVATIEGGKLVLRHPEVSHPTGVRYAWDQDPVCCLENEIGLPASPFEWRGSV